MTAPGSRVTTLGVAPPRLAPIRTGVKFACGPALQGPVGPQPITSLAGFTNIYGARDTRGYSYDDADAFFQEGGSLEYFSRVVGPSPVYATVNLLDGSAGISLVVTAKYYGTYANGWKIIVTGSGPYVITVEDANSVLLETSPSLTSQADAVAYGLTSAFINITQGAGAIMVAESNKVLASGTDDFADATDTHWENAIALLPFNLGPGQISMPGRTTATAHLNLLAHGAANNRRALLDYTDTASRSTLVAAAATDRADADPDYGGTFAPWAQIGGLTAGTTRTVPMSSIIAGIIARNDNAGVSPNQPSAGEKFGQSLAAIGLSQVPWSEGDGGDRDLLNQAGVNVVLLKSGVVTVYGYRTLANPTDDTKWLELSNSRLVMAITDLAKSILDGYVFDLIDGLGHLQSDLYGDLSSMLAPFWTGGSLFGATASEAFTVDVGPNVNTPETLAAQQLGAVIGLRMSPFAEFVFTQVVTTAIAQGS